MGVLFVRRVNQRYNLEVNPVVLLQQDFSLAQFALYLISQKSSLSPSLSSSPRSTTDWQSEIDRLWTQDCSFFLHNEPNSRHRDSKRDLVLLTGATGFLGKHVLMELLLSSQSIQSSTNDLNEHYVCLVRCKEESDGVTRVLNALKEAMCPPNPISKIEEYLSSTSPRVRILRGDTNKELFGLPRDEFESLSGRLKAVYHIASNTNTLLKYDSLRASNVLSTVTAMRLAYMAGELWLELPSSFKTDIQYHFVLIDRSSISSYINNWSVW